MPVAQWRLRHQPTKGSSAAKQKAPAATGAKFSADEFGLLQTEPKESLAEERSLTIPDWHSGSPKEEPQAIAMT